MNPAHPMANGISVGTHTATVTWNTGLTPSGNPASRVDDTGADDRYWITFSFDPIAAGLDVSPGPHTITVSFPGNMGAGRPFDALIDYTYTP